MDAVAMTPPTAPAPEVEAVRAGCRGVGEVPHCLFPTCHDDRAGINRPCMPAKMILRAIAALDADRERRGLVLAPVEPTKEMIDAVAVEGLAPPATVYRAMIARVRT